VTIASEKYRRSIFGNLAEVGGAKPLGYLPLATIKNHLDLDADALADSFVKQGLKAKVFQPNECCIKSGALYVFDPPVPQQVLDAASVVLENSSWPTDAELFVNQVAKIWVDQNQPVYAVIRRAFGEADG
jgi:hypothetical protein